MKNAPKGEADSSKREWSEWRDSNPRPLVPQTSALTGLRYTPTARLIEKAPAACNLGNPSATLFLRQDANQGKTASMRMGGAQNALRLLDFGEGGAQGAAHVSENFSGLECGLFAMG